MVLIPHGSAFEFSRRSITIHGKHHGRKALIVWGGWDGHQPQQVAEIFERELQAKALK